MSIHIDEAGLCGELEELLQDPGFRAGLSNLVSDPFLLAFFLVSVSQGEGLGEAAVGMIGQDELAARIRGLARQQADERRHKETTLETARELFPEFFDGDRYRYDATLQGRAYYVSVLEANRTRLEQLGRLSRLSLYFTTTFGYEIMVLLLYRAVADAVVESPLPSRVRERVRSVLESILAEEETHVGVVDQHNALLASSRDDLSSRARDLLERLEAVTADDYLHCAERSVFQVIEMMRSYAEPVRVRSEIETGALATV